MAERWDLVVQGGTVITTSESFVADVAVSQGRVAALGRLEGLAAAQGAQVVDAEGMVVVPGGVDCHVHLDMPYGGSTNSDDFASGSVAALFGGTTTIIDFATPGKGEALELGFEARRRKADGRCSTDYGFHMVMTRVCDKTLREMDRMVRQGVTSFKLFTSNPQRLMSDDGAIFRAMRRTRDNGGLVCMHAENGRVIEELIREALAAGNTGPRFHPLTRPMEAEAEATARVIALAEMAGAPVYVMHLSAARALDEVRRGRKRGVKVLSETCPQYLFLTADEYERPGFEAAKFVSSPPLRPRGNETRLWQALRDGELQAVSTDHCSFSMRSKGGKPRGAPGIGTRMLLMWDAAQRGRISPQRFVEVVASAPARIFGLYPRKGHLAPGADADIVVIDPRKTHAFGVASHHLRVDYEPYEGRTAHGVIREVFLRGRRMVSHGRFVGKPGGGAFLRRAPRDF
ncbi:MAG: dihydropyrimidinase [Elusimicrobia bacterium]|nr:dihydropyrimidinase [Elusimicrobiota bacterium]